MCTRPTHPMHGSCKQQSDWLSNFTQASSAVCYQAPILWHLSGHFRSHCQALRHSSAQCCCCWPKMWTPNQGVAPDIVCKPTLRDRVGRLLIESCAAMQAWGCVRMGIIGAASEREASPWSGGGMRPSNTAGTPRRVCPHTPGDAPRLHLHGVTFHVIELELLHHASGFAGSPADGWERCHHP